MGKINSDRKGKAGEREFAKFLRTRGVDARRGQQHAGGGDSPDVIHDLPLPVHFEVKRVEKLSLYVAMAQAREDGGKQMPVVAHRRNDEEWLAVLPMADFIRLVLLAAHSDFIDEFTAPWRKP